MTSNVSDLFTGIGARLVISRGEIGLSQTEMAKRLGVSLRAYHSYEKGDRGLPIEALVGLHEQFDVDVNWVLLGSKSVRSEHDFDALQKFEAGLDQYLKFQKISIASEKRGAIVSRWYRSHIEGKTVEMDDVHTWIELVRE